MGKKFTDIDFEGIGNSGEYSHGRILIAGLDFAKPTPADPRISRHDIQGQSARGTNAPNIPTNTDQRFHVGKPPLSKA
jgi:hypothetical protein